LKRLRPQGELVGLFSQPGRELVRFRVNNTLAFPPGQIESIQDDRQAQMLVNFMGLTGPAGVLPYVMTEFIYSREREEDYCLRDFLDLFNHRMISLFYRAWERSHFFVAYERDQSDRFSHHLLALIGLGTSGLQKRQEPQGITDRALTFYTGLLSLQPRSAAALEQVLEDYFRVPVEVEQFVGGWYTLSRRDQCLFEDRPSLSNQLGGALVVGDAVWDQQCRVCIKVGPLTAQRYLEFLPEGKAHRSLCALSQFFGKGQVEFQLQLILKRDEVPVCELGREDAGGPLLNWFSWLRSGPALDRDPGDTILLLR
jgi:type VI secretion system protein ImpH